MNGPDAFLKALAENEDDVTTRLVYSDWLDEHGEHEEAERQRAWPAAKQWLARLCEVNNKVDLEDVVPIGYQRLLELGLAAVAEENDGFHCGNNYSMCDALRGNYLEFWKNWSIVTGIPLPFGYEKTCNFRCAC